MGLGAHAVLCGHVEGGQELLGWDDVQRAQGNVEDRGIFGKRDYVRKAIIGVVFVELQIVKLVLGYGESA